VGQLSVVSPNMIQLHYHQGGHVSKSTYFPAVKVIINATLSKNSTLNGISLAMT